MRLEGRAKNSQACMLRAPGGSAEDRGAVLSLALALSRCWPKPAAAASWRAKVSTVGKQLLPARSHLGLDFSGRLSVSLQPHGRP